MTHRSRIFVSVALFLATVPLTLGASQAPAGATHFRANQVNWHTTAIPGEVEFHLTGSWRLSAYLYESQAGAGDHHDTPSIGDVFVPTDFQFGDGQSYYDYWFVTAVDVLNDVVSAEAHVPHQYDSVGPWTAYIDSCCRLSAPAHRNNPDGGSRVASLVNSEGTSSSPVSQIPPIVDCPVAAPCDFFIPATDADQQSIRFRLAEPSEAASYGGFAQPDGASVDSNTGLYRWDTTGASLNQECSGGMQSGVSCDSFFSTQVIVENLDEQGAIVATTPVDFFIRVTESPNSPPTFAAPTPADGTRLELSAGEPVTISVAASDPNASDQVTLGMIGKPNDATFHFVAGNPATGTFTWQNPGIGDHLLTFVAQDQLGRGALPRSVTLSVRDLPAFIEPTPVDGTRIRFFSADVGRFTVKARDPQAGDTVTLGSMGIPPGGTYQYVGLPGNPSEAVVRWAPGTVGTFQMILTATDQSGNQAVTRAVVLEAIRTPTSLLVQPAVARINGSTVTAGPGGVVNNGVYALFATARLQVGAGADEAQPESIGDPVAGRKISFFAGTTHLCDAVTRADGVAFCQGTLASRHLETLAAGGYRATFSGDAAFAGSAGNGSIVET